MPHVTHIDLTIDDSDDDGYSHGDRPAAGSGNTPGQQTRTKQSPHHSGRKVITPSKCMTASTPRSGRSHGKDGSPRSGLNDSRARNSTDNVAQHLALRESATRREEALNVDKIANQLKSYAVEIDKANARLVLFSVREVMKNTPEPRHVSSVDHFANMPSIAEEQGSASDGAALIRFKVCI